MPPWRLVYLTLRKEFETSEKIWGYVAGEGEFENRGQEPQGPPKRAQKNLKKNSKSIGNAVVATLCVSGESAAHTYMQLCNQVLSFIE